MWTLVARGGGRDAGTECRPIRRPFQGGSLRARLDAGGRGGRSTGFHPMGRPLGCGGGEGEGWGGGWGDVAGHAGGGTVGSTLGCQAAGVVGGASECRRGGGTAQGGGGEGKARHGGGRVGGTDSLPEPWGGGGGAGTPCGPMSGPVFCRHRGGRGTGDGAGGQAGHAGGGASCPLSKSGQERTVRARRPSCTEAFARPAHRRCPGACGPTWAR